MQSLNTAVDSLTCCQGMSLDKHMADSTDAQCRISDCSNRQHRHHSAVHRCGLDNSTPYAHTQFKT